MGAPWRGETGVALTKQKPCFRGAHVLSFTPQQPGAQSPSAGQPRGSAGAMRRAARPPRRSPCSMPSHPGVSSSSLANASGTSNAMPDIPCQPVIRDRGAGLQRSAAGGRRGIPSAPAAPGGTPAGRSQPGGGRRADGHHAQRHQSARGIPQAHTRTVHSPPLRRCARLRCGHPAGASNP